MGFLPLSFGLPAVLIGLLALPAIWWLLRLTPPRPQKEVFPPLRILARVLKSEETPHQSPWWLTLLRLLMAALIIFALAEPVLNQRETAATSGNALAIVMDNGWASAPDWDVRGAIAVKHTGGAGDAWRSVFIGHPAGYGTAEPCPPLALFARLNLAVATSHPAPAHPPPVYARVPWVFEALSRANIAVKSDGLA